MATNAQGLGTQWSSLLSLLTERWHHLTDEDLRVLEEDLDQLVSRIQQRTGEAREVIEARLADVTARAGAAAGRYADEMGHRIRKRVDRAEDIVRHKPGQALVAAFACGVAAGVLVTVFTRSR